ncbi:hypothetical protein H0H81_002328 [Sphagnurus paluster]|uniref:Nephrocystin 3-like N-terminal domain-containing protein n=1 Tax=Sphagnurus paluster TaxID=117069 RepID=A0A9P7GR61_9AGAR|nr:hypothetical protein H0H81_002328 [Sphagnurus paluster]
MPGLADQPATTAPNTELPAAIYQEASITSNSLQTLPFTAESDISNTPASPQADIGTKMSKLPQDNHYTVIGGLSTALVAPGTTVQQMEPMGSVIFEGLKLVLQGLYDCSDSFLPLKAATGAFLRVIDVVETVSGNKKELEDLKAKLEAIIMIVKRYQKYNGLSAIENRISSFCFAITVQLNAVQELADHSLVARTVEGKKDASIILKALQNINTLCDVFQMDTQLNTEDMVKDILKVLESATIEKLNHEMTSYKTRHSSHGNPTGCMKGTRVKILEDLNVWASDSNQKKVYWMVGMAGTGKSTISHTLCEILDGKNLLGASFFASRASNKTNDARLIVPVIAYGLARDSPSLTSEILKAVKNDPALAEPTYNNLYEQFQKLVYDPICKNRSKNAGQYKVIIIDALDECTDFKLVFSLIQLVLKFTSDIPLKVLISSCDETLIRNAFNSKQELLDAFYLHEVEKDVVSYDIKQYLETSLTEIQDYYYGPPTWPSQDELVKLVDLSGRLFIYAATAVHCIDDDDYQEKMSNLISSASKFESD